MPNETTRIDITLTPDMVLDAIAALLKTQSTLINNYARINASDYDLLPVSIQNCIDEALNQSGFTKPAIYSKAWEVYANAYKAWREELYLLQRDQDYVPSLYALLCCGYHVYVDNVVIDSGIVRFSLMIEDKQTPVRWP